MIELVIFASFLGVTFISGSLIEKKHLAQLRKREGQLNTIPWRSTGKKEVFTSVESSELLTGHVVIAQDAFKSTIAGLINIFGGRVTVYEALLDRGRREAICRLRECAKQKGFNEIVNVRLETSTLGSNNGQQNSGAIEVFAYGTGIVKGNRNG